MFNLLQTKLDQAFSMLRGKSRITADDVESTLKEVRMALLEADVHFKVVKELCSRLATRLKGEEVLKALSPSQHIIKAVHEEIVAMVGEGHTPLNLNVSAPMVIMIVGLQGSGKTTSCGKLANYLKKEHKKKVLLVPADIYRPAAILQLTQLGSRIGVDVFPSTVEMDPLEICTAALEKAKSSLYDVVILDTAGRLQIDTDLMQELGEIANAVDPHEVLFVADAMTGQEAVNVARGFNEVLDIDGIVLTKLDGDARGGAALSMRFVLEKPIKFVSLSEKVDGLEPFHPERFAQRVLGMGDVVSLIEKVQKQVSDEEAKALNRKFKKNEFSLQDFLSQLRKIKEMGSMKSIMGMLPGFDKISGEVDFDQAEGELKRVEAIILSMTPYERENHAVINGSRRKRIASGAGVSVQDVNRILKQFLQMKSMMHKISKGGISSLMKSIPGLGRMGGR